MILGVLVSAALALAPTAMPRAQTASSVGEPCAAIAAPPPELAGWADRTRLMAATQVGDVTDAVLSPDRATDLGLSPAGELEYALSPERPEPAGGFGGLVALAIEADGVYRVALGSGAWVDVVRDGQTVASSDHGHGPACSGVRKLVDFPLERGNYVLQISGSTTPSVAVMIVRLP